ncbi:ribbon-helix-helix protein, CopG family [Pseudomonas paraversuta]|uniref:ribbon-helix-helix protein, CopG family n=1 Tax=Pseudomonas TaxID=286 RepID=UPI000495E6EF|nr:MULTISPECIES: ribbon-helix-helix protein, CopG family [Pseudomonas]
MNKKSTRLTILIDTPTKEKLEALSEMADLTVSQILRKLIKNHLNTLEVPNNLPPGESSNVSSHIIN